MAADDELVDVIRTVVNELLDRRLPRDERAMAAGISEALAETLIPYVNRIDAVEKRVMRAPSAMEAMIDRKLAALGLQRAVPRPVLTVSRQRRRSS